MNHFGFAGGEEAAKLFEKWDVDGSGALSFSELNNVLRRVSSTRAADGSRSLPSTDSRRSRSIEPVSCQVDIASNWSRQKTDGASGLGASSACTP